MSAEACLKFAPPSRLTVYVQQARGLADLVAGGSGVNSFVELELAGRKHRTRVEPRSGTPEWKQSFDFFVSAPSEVLHVRVLHRGAGGVEFDTLGQLEVPLTSLADGRRRQEWHALVLPPAKQRAAENAKRRGDGVAFLANAVAATAREAASLPSAEVELVLQWYVHAMLR